MITCILLRHAATAGNLAGRYIGFRSDEDITREKDSDILQVSDQIRGILCDPVVISGPQRRCINTASVLFPDKNPLIADGLSEMDFGSFEGRTYDELKGLDEYRSWIGGMVDSPPGGESRDEFIRRSMRGFDDAMKLAAGGKEILIICSGGNIMAVMSSLTGRDYYDFHTGNLEGFILRFDHYDKGIHGLSYDRFGVGRNT
ncbi:MAG: histidine phosphatase family protein [Lachnospiraceae bacterium]|nr:histidine phosphatase family protein [Lachnospiraceae bacterium]